ncbi:hypothetical protein K456DRAFT_326136 [Colletotrichum gloeosporioides 23]|nr:hypothetical protein K456DRAFT_326136 [Colletotrichum gloeosporioides 23]
MSADICYFGRVDSVSVSVSVIVLILGYKRKNICFFGRQSCYVEVESHLLCYHVVI